MFAPAPVLTAYNRNCVNWLIIVLLVARESHLSGCFWLFVPNFGSWWETMNHLFAQK